MADEEDVPTGAPADEAQASEAAQVDEQQPEATAGTDAEADSSDDGIEGTADEPRKPAKGVQKRLDELTRRIHEERREKERLLALLERGTGQTQQHPQPAAQTAPPREDQFASYDEYEAARIEYAVEQRLKTAREIEQRERAAQSFTDRVNAVRDKLPDYDLYVGDPTLPITPLMAEVIRESDVGPEVAYHLGKNRSEATRIANLPPHRQAAELGRLEARLSIDSQPKPTPKPIPPAPPQTVAGLSAGLSKGPEEMSMAEYVEWVRTRDKT